VATTERGREAARRHIAHSGRIDVLDLGTDHADLVMLMKILNEEYGVHTLLCEGGARVYGSLLRAGQVDDEFLTLCPTVIGNRPTGPARPSLVEGVAFMPGATPRLRLVSLRRAGDYLFLRSQFCRPHRLGHGSGA
jgi:5-amino-6-(5-phosphoribosylamino)uracil reductase